MKRTEIFKKAIAAILSLLLIPAGFLIDVSGRTENFTEKEAKELILAAHNLYIMSHIVLVELWPDYIPGKPYDSTESGLTLPAETVRRNSREIYAEEIADKMWMYQCTELYSDVVQASGQTGVSLGPEFAFEHPLLEMKKYDIGGKTVTLLNGGKTYYDNGDGTVTFVPYQFTYPREYFIPRIIRTRAPLNEDEKIYPKEPEDITLRNFKVNGKTASADVLMNQQIKYTQLRPLGHFHLIWVSVVFSDTDEGWRISGGNLIFAFSEWNNENFRTIPAYGGAIDDLFVYKTEQHLSRIAGFACSFGDPDFYWRAEKDGKPYSPALDQTGLQRSFVFEKVLKISSTELEVVLDERKWLPDYSFEHHYYDAVFSFDPNYKYWAYQFQPYDYTDKYPNGHEMTGAWRLTGGSVYDMATGKTDVEEWKGDLNARTVFIIDNSSPDTGDVSGIYFCAAVAAAVTSSVVLLRVRRRRFAGE